MKIANKISLIIITLLLTNCAVKKTGRFYGKVKSVEILKYTFPESSDNKKTLFSHNIGYFNRKGQPTLGMKYKTDDGSLYQKRTLKYDSSGNLAQGFLGFKNGDTIKTRIPVCKYDKKNNFTEITYYHDNNNLQKYNVITFENGKEIAQSNYSIKGVLLQKVINKYNKKGSQIQEEIHTIKPDGSFDIEISLKNEYDKRGNKIAMYRYSKGKLDDKHIYEYDRKNNKIASKFYREGKLVFNNTYEYDKRGNQVAKNGLNNDGSLNYKITSEYKFDTNGNWIEKKEFYDGEYHNKSPHGITEIIFDYQKE